MKIVSIVGARPQFIKLAAINRALNHKPGIKHLIIHTHQHYDKNMSGVFFEELDIPKPDYLLNLTELNLSADVKRMEEGISAILQKETPAAVVVYGDTNSTLAGARAAVKLAIPLAHIEAGLRSYDSSMPEEFNRIETDKISNLLFCPTKFAVENLAKETGINGKIVFSGDVMLDALQYYLPKVNNFSTISYTSPFALATIHRQSTVQSKHKLIQIIRAFNGIDKEMKVLFPVHPRTRTALETTGEKINFALSEPVGYLQMLSLLSSCNLVLTDSGGLQKEAFFCRKMCITLRDNTEWMELVNAGVNIIAGTDYQVIIDAFKRAQTAHPAFDQPFYGSGKSSEIIVNEIINSYA